MAIKDNWITAFKVESNSLQQEKNQGIAQDCYSELLNKQPAILKQIVPINDENGTRQLLVCGEVDTRYFDCDFYVDGKFQDDGDSMLLTAEQLELFNALGNIEYNSEEYKVQKIVPLISSDEETMRCKIYLNAVAKE